MPHLPQPPTPLSFLQRIFPYVILGAAFTIGLGLAILLAIIIAMGALVGLIYYGIRATIQRYRPVKPQNTSPKQATKGRIIEHDDL